MTPLIISQQRAAAHNIAARIEALTYAVEVLRDADNTPGDVRAICEAMLDKLHDLGRAAALAVELLPVFEGDETR